MWPRLHLMKSPQPPRQHHQLFRHHSHEPVWDVLDSNYQITLVQTQISSEDIAPCCHCPKGYCNYFIGWLSIVPDNSSGILLTKRLFFSSWSHPGMATTHSGFMWKMWKWKVPAAITFCRSLLLSSHLCRQSFHRDPDQLCSSSCFSNNHSETYY